MCNYDLKKEFRSGIRDNKFLILAVGFLFFALLSPVMMKVMPQIVQSQFPNMTQEAISAMVNISQLDCIKGYMGDVFEIGTIIVVFTLCGIISQEIKENTIVLPICAGKRFGGIVLSKQIVFGTSLMLIPTIALFADYAYAGILLGYDLPSVLPILWGGLMQGVYMNFLLSCIMMFGTFVKRPIATGVLTLIVAYGTHAAAAMLNMLPYVPTGLLREAEILSATLNASLLPPLLITICLIIALYGMAIARLKRMEFNRH